MKRSRTRTRPPPARPPLTRLPPTFGAGAVSGGGFNAAAASGIDVSSVPVGCVAHFPATASPQHRVVSWSRTVARDFELALAMECVQGVMLDVPAVPPPRGLDGRLLLCTGLLALAGAAVGPRCIRDTSAVVEATWNRGLNDKLLGFGLGCGLTRTATLRRHIGVANLTVAAVNGRGSSYFCGYLLDWPLAVQDLDRNTTFARAAA